MTKKFSLIDDNLRIYVRHRWNFFFQKKLFSPEKLKKKSRNPHQMQLQSPFSKRKSHMITKSDALTKQNHLKNASKMIKFPCDISPCNILSYRMWYELLRYCDIRYRVASVYESLLFFMCRIAKRYFSAISHIAHCIGSRSFFKKKKLQKI